MGVLDDWIILELLGSGIAYEFVMAFQTRGGGGQPSCLEIGDVGGGAFPQGSTLPNHQIILDCPPGHTVVAFRTKTNVRFSPNCSGSGRDMLGRG
jgi:hypothetical protein